jgi:hypothetical protein
MRMRKFPFILLLPGPIGALFTGMFVASWVAYFWGDGDGERAAFLTVVAVFAVPLLVGSIQLTRRRRSGLGMLRFGCALLLCEPRIRRLHMTMDEHLDFAEYMAGGSSEAGGGLQA